MKNEEDKNTNEKLDEIKEKIEDISEEGFDLYENQIHPLTEILGCIIEGILMTFLGIVVSVVLTKMEFGEAEMEAKILLIPFLCMFYIVIILGILYTIQGLNLCRGFSKNVSAKKIMDTQEKTELLVEFIKKIVTIIFFIFWFGGLIYFDVSQIQEWNNGGSVSFYFSLLFWGVGVWAVYEKFFHYK